EVFCASFPADVLEHPDAHDLVERRPAEIAIVEQLEADSVLQPCFANPLPTQLQLRAAERYSHALHAVALGGVDQHSSPSAADVEQPLSGLEPELAADQLELGFLSAVEVLRSRGEIGA